MSDDHAHYRSPTLNSAGAILEGMKLIPLCADCQAAQWYAIDKADLECFCTHFRGVMYGRDRRAVTSCDAREDIIDGINGR